MNENKDNILNELIIKVEQQNLLINKLIEESTRIKIGDIVEIKHNDNYNGNVLGFLDETKKIVIEKFIIVDITNMYYHCRKHNSDLRSFYDPSYTVNRKYEKKFSLDYPHIKKI